MCQTEATCLYITNTRSLLSIVLLDRAVRVVFVCIYVSTLYWYKVDNWFRMAYMWCRNVQSVY